MIDLAQWKAGSLEIWREGDGPTVGYLHGMVCAPGRQPFVSELAGRGFRVVAPSLPGYSRTSPSVDIRNIHDWVFALSEIIETRSDAAMASCDRPPATARATIGHPIRHPTGDESAAALWWP